MKSANCGLKTGREAMSVRGKEGSRGDAERGRGAMGGGKAMPPGWRAEGNFERGALVLFRHLTFPRRVHDPKFKCQDLTPRP